MAELLGDDRPNRPGGERLSSTPNLDRFIEASTDEARMALGEEVLRAALNEAAVTHQLGWEEAVFEYVHNWPDGPNRPLSSDERIERG